MGAYGVLVAALGGWGGLAVAVVALRRARGRLERVARAEHELRGPVAVLALTRDRMEREPTGRRYARALEVELERLTTGLADLTAARSGARRQAPSSPVEPRRTADRSSDLRAFAGGALAGWAPVLRAAGRRTRFDWKAGRVALPLDRGRVAQALGNLVANAAEHGAGEVEVRGRRVPGGVRVEIRNGLREEEGTRRDRDRGRGLPIAVDAARELGGTVVTDRGPRSFRAALELPVSEASLRLRERLAAGTPRTIIPVTSRGSGPAPARSQGPAAPRGSRPPESGPARPVLRPPGAHGTWRSSPPRPPRPPVPPRPPIPPRPPLSPRRMTGNRRRM